MVLGFVRSAIGIPQTPPNQVLTGLAMFLTFFIMTPTLTTINNTALQPLLANKITQAQAMDRAQVPIRQVYGDKQVRQSDLSLMVYRGPRAASAYPGRYSDPGPDFPPSS